MGVKHIHAELIKAWADGAAIEALTGPGWWLMRSPSWSATTIYRIKPTPPKEPDYGRIAQEAFVTTGARCPERWPAAAAAVIKAYQQYQEDMKVYQNGTA